MLYFVYNDPQHFLFLAFLKPVLTEVQSVNKKFESQNQDPAKLVGYLVILIKSLCTKVILTGVKLDVLKTALSRL